MNGWGRAMSRFGALAEQVIALCVGGVFVRTGVVHLENSYAFLGSIYAYDLVSPTAGIVLAMVLPALQLTLGVLLLFHSGLRKVSYGCSALLLLVFAVVQCVTLARGLNISCGCFDAGDDNPIGVFSIGLALGFSGLSGIGYVLKSGTRLVPLQQT